ncbi:MAG: ATP-binding protein [Bacteroidales bacterium]|nr:ATP-binding protein [Bacteroidales bacterium]
MKIERPVYLNELIRSKGNGSIRIITGIRRCGKSYLLKILFRDHLLKDGIPADHIIVIDLEDRKQAAFKDPDYLMDYIDKAMMDSETYYILIDEVQQIGDFVSVLASLNLKDNTEIYVTGSNSKFLSKDVATEFRGRGDEIHMYPLSFSEFLTAFDGNDNEAWLEYYTFGGLPQVLLQDGEDKKTAFLKNLYKTVYLKDIYERHIIDNPAEFEELVKVMASSIGSPLNPNKLANTFKSLKNTKDLTNKTIATYMDYMDDAFLTEKTDRYDIKGKHYIASLSKYYFQDPGLRNAILSFRQTEENHLMESIIYNELRYRGFLVDVGNVTIRTKDSDGKPIRVTLEVDFVANKGSKRYYIQSAWRIPDEEKLQQETRSLNAISDSFKKIVVTGENIRLKRDENGIATIPIIQFLKDPNSLDL